MSAVIEAIRTEQTGLAIDQLPQPQGYYMLVRMVKAPQKVGSIHIPESRQADETVANPLAEVVLMGPDCFANKEQFPSGPRCQVGDVILMAPYSGIRVLLGSEVEADEYRIIHDGIPAAVVPNPSIVRRGL